MGDRVDKIIRHWAEADEMEAGANERRWIVAELIAAELAETGKSQRALAAEIGKSQSHVKIMKHIGSEYLGTHDLHSLTADDIRREVSFHKAYRWAKAGLPACFVRCEAYGWMESRDRWQIAAIIRSCINDGETFESLAEKIRTTEGYKGRLGEPDALKMYSDAWIAAGLPEPALGDKTALPDADFWETVRKETA